MNPSLLQLGNIDALEMGNRILLEIEIFKSCMPLQNLHGLVSVTNLHLGLNPNKPHKRNFSIVTTKAPKGYYKLQMPVKSKQCLNLCKGTSLVNMSAGLSAVLIFLRRISPSSIISRMKWKRTSICLVRE